MAAPFTDIAILPKIFCLKNFKSKKNQSIYNLKHLTLQSIDHQSMSFQNIYLKLQSHIKTQNSTDEQFNKQNSCSTNNAAIKLSLVILYCGNHVYYLPCSKTWLQNLNLWTDILLYCKMCKRKKIKIFFIMHAFP